MTNIPESVHRLVQAGITEADARTLRKISMTLHRWHELECGVSNGAIERDETTGTPYWHARCYSNQRCGTEGARYKIADREAGARRRLKRIMANYPGFTAYVQTDPRGCALYILRPGDVPTGADVSTVYNRGVAVYK